MITNISVLNSSASRVSVGEFNHVSRELRVWIYATRFVKEGDEQFAIVPAFPLDEYKHAKEVMLVDMDWDYRYPMTFKDFKAIKVKDGVRKVNMSKLSALK